MQNTVASVRVHFGALMKFFFTSSDTSHSINKLTGSFNELKLKFMSFYEIMAIHSERQLFLVRQRAEVQLLSWPLHNRFLDVEKIFLDLRYKSEMLSACFHFVLKLGPVCIQNVFCFACFYVAGSSSFEWLHLKIYFACLSLQFWKCLTNILGTEARIVCGANGCRWESVHLDKFLKRTTTSIPTSTIVS